MPNKPSLTILALTLTLAAAAGSHGQTAAPQEPEVKLEEMTCGGLELLVGDDSRTQDTTYLMIWAYGVRTGAQGADLRKHPFTESALTAFVQELLAACEKDSDARVLPLITGQGAAK